MTKKPFSQALFLIALVLTGPALEAQIVAKCIDGRNPITGERCANAAIAAVPFLRIVPDARGGGMGDVGIATSADPNGIHYNQSKLAFGDKKVSISASYTPWMRNLEVQEVFLAYLAGYVQLDKFQTVGLGLRYFSLGDIEFTDNHGGPLSHGRPSEYEVTAAYARKLSENFAAAIGAKFIYSDLATGQVVEGDVIKPGVAAAADISLTYKREMKNGSELTIGAALSNLGSKITYTNSIHRDYLPANLGLGVAWKFNLDAYNTLTFSTDFNKLLVPILSLQLDTNGNSIPVDISYTSFHGLFESFSDSPGGFSEEINEISTGIGAEYWYNEKFALRAGYFYEHYSKGNRKYFSLGLGAKYKVLGLNISYVVPSGKQRNPLGNTLRFSLLFNVAALERE